MNKERIIKKQAREALRGNMTALIAGFLTITVALVAVYYIFVTPAVALSVVDPDTDAVADDKELLYMLLALGALALSMFVSPLVNGFLKLAADTAVEGRCEIADLFYYFSRPSLFFRTLAVNAVLISIFAIISLPVDLAALVLGDSVPEAVVVIVKVIWRLFAYIFFVHYPLAAYALDEKRPVHFYLFGCIGFSFRYSGALLRLIFSMFGWIALCFFVLPALYAVPYISVALMNSARWLFAMNQKI